MIESIQGTITSFQAAVEQRGRAPRAAEQPEPERKKPAQEEKAEKTDRSERGVLRLLQEGHFHGVADVRLRMNFSEELESLGTDPTAPEAGVVPEQPLEDTPPGPLLPPLEAPDNNGRAYQKFLDQYLGTSVAGEDMVPEPAPVPPEESLDLIA